MAEAQKAEISILPPVEPGTPVPATDARHSVFVLDGVGGWLFCPLLVRRALREAGLPLVTHTHDWHRGLRGDLLTDLMWLKMNRFQAIQLARRIRTLHRDDPEHRIDLIGFSGGGGVAVLTMEYLRDAQPLDTVILMAPALSPRYDLSTALSAARRCYHLFSCRDRFLLGAGTGLFGTIDRVRTSAAGRLGFLKPEAGGAGAEAYSKLRQIAWTPDLDNGRHAGGHTGWIDPGFLRRHLPGLLADSPDLDYVAGWLEAD